MISEYLQKIISFYHKNRRMPSYSEILKITGFKSKNAAYKIVKRLVDLGMLAKDRSGKILPTAHFDEIKILGTVEAGFPALAEQQLIDTVTLDKLLIRNRAATYLLQVAGDSMIDAGILPKDLVLVEKDKPAKIGDIVIAQVDGDWTIKYLQKKNNKIYLQAANKRYKPIFPRENLHIGAVVNAIIRKYR